jgi:hypothetical protein
VEAAIRRVDPAAAKFPPSRPYEHALQYSRAGSRRVESGIDKVKIAHAVADQPAVLEVLDLKQRITQLVEFIRSAND